jgi:hypothetical protein
MDGVSSRGRGLLVEVADRPHLGARHRRRVCGAARLVNQMDLPFVRGAQTIRR